MNKKFLQPNTYSCVPTSLAYLIYKSQHIDFNEILNRLLDVSEQLFNLKKDGMEFDQLDEVCLKLKIDSFLSKIKPEDRPYLTGVKKLPKIFQYDQSLKEAAIKDGAMIESDDYYYFPEGHAIVVFRNTDKLFIFDSFSGDESEIEDDILNDCLEDRVEYFYIK